MEKLKNFFARDVDEILAYKTQKMVRIRDRRLCITRLLLILAVFLYTIVFEVIIEQGYMKRDVPVGGVHIRGLDAPALGLPRAPAPYCGPEFKGKLNAATLPCKEWGTGTLVRAADSSRSIFVVTRFNYTVTTGRKDPSDPEACHTGDLTGCLDRSRVMNSSAYYTRDPESVSILVQHAVFGFSTLGLLRQESDMGKRELYNSDGKLVKTFANNLGDTLTVAEVLRASSSTSSSLESESTSSPGESNRYSGVTVLAVLYYETRQSKLSDLKYKMRLVNLPGVEFKYFDVMYSENSTHVTETTYTKHGVTLIVQQGGSIGTFKFVELLKTLVAGAGLLSISKFLVDKLFLRVFRNAKIYRAYKYIDTVDFSDLHLDPQTKAPSVFPAFGDPYKLEADDFVYGTLLRGDYHKPLWGNAKRQQSAPHAEESPARGRGLFHHHRHQPTEHVSTAVPMPTPSMYEMNNPTTQYTTAEPPATQTSGGTRNSQPSNFNYYDLYNYSPKE